MTDLEARVARLERRIAIWQLVAMGSALGTGVMITNSCSRQSAPPATPDHLELRSKDASLLLDPERIVLRRGKSSLTLDSSKILLEANDQQLAASAGSLALGTGNEQSTLKPGALSLRGEAGIIEAHVSPENATLTLESSTHRNEVGLMVGKTYSSVHVRTIQESPTESFGALIWSSLEGTSLTLNWKRTQKVLSLGK